MKYSNIVRATFVERLNRFVAVVELDGRRETVHVKNTGRCRELLIPGSDVYLTAPGTAGRKLRYDLVAVRKAGGLLVNIDSMAPNKAMAEWLSTQPFSLVKPEFRFGSSRIDFMAEYQPGDPPALLAAYRTSVSRTSLTHVTPAQDFAAPCRLLMEVKGCTLEIDGNGFFPDAPTIRGAKHLRELTCALSQGYDSVLAFVIQMEGVSEVFPNTVTDPEFAKALSEATFAGVRQINFICRVEPDGIEIIGCGPPGQAPGPTPG